jgi:hypothetical protein
MPFALRVPDATVARPTQISVAVTVALVLLAGCSFGGSDPAPTAADAAPRVAAAPTPSTTPSPTSTPKPERPAAMDTVNLDGAIATATYFLQLFPYALNTGDLTDWAVLSHPECIFCRGLTTEVGRQKGLGQHQEGTVMAIGSATGIEIDHGVWFSVDVRFTQGAWAVADSRGTVVENSADTESLQANLIVIRDANQWLIRGVHVDPADA